MKECSRCLCTKSPDSFTAYIKNSDGLRAWCKQCVREYNSQYRRMNKEAIRLQCRDYRASIRDDCNAKRKQYYAANSEFAELARQKQRRWRENNREAHRAYTRKWESDNRAHMLVRKRAYYDKNKDSIQASIRKWKRENPEALRDYWHNREALKRNAGGRHTRAEIADLLEKQNGLCAVCEVDITEKRHRDHVVALSAGGSNDITNIQLLCPDCNLSKRAKSMEVFLLERRT